MDAKDEHIAKVAIKIKDTRELISLDKTKTLRENVIEICRKYDIDTPESRGLKLLAKGFQDEDKYVQESTFQNITNGSELELVLSVEEMVQKIFQKQFNKPLNFTEFSKLKTDPVFLETIVQRNLDEEVQRVIEDYDLSDSELSTCLITLLQLLKTRQINVIRRTILVKIIEIVKNAKPTRAPVLQHLIAMLNQILYMKRTGPVREYQQKIIDEISISHLMKFCEHAKESLQINIIKLVNTIVKSVKDDKKSDLIKELRKQRDCIFTYIIRSRNELSHAMAFELYVYQSFLLRDKYKTSLDIKIDLTNEMLNVFDEIDEETRRNSDLLDFQEGLNKSKWYSTDTISEKQGSRFSLATRISTASTFKTLSNYSELSVEENCSICYRTYENLSHYKNEHRANYNQSHVEENAYESGIIISSDRITKMLAKILQVDSRLSKSAHNYHPLVFNTCLSHDDFLAELFCRTMWLLSKTRREMKAYVLDDFEKVLKVLERQIRMVLDKKPTDMKELLSHMKDITAKAVYDQWQKEKDSDWRYVLDNNQSVQELKLVFNEQNMKFVLEQRISILKLGTVFPKLPEKKNKQQYFHIHLSDNMKTVHKFDYDEHMGKLDEIEQFEVSNIRHVIIGKNCPHFKDNTAKQEKLVFSFQLEGDVHHNFLAKNEKIANYWIDGFNLLLGKEFRSEDYVKDLNTLTEMDCALQLLELQDTHLYTRPAPPIPPLPPKPAIPPRGPNLLRMLSLTRSTIHNSN